MHENLASIIYISARVSLFLYLPSLFLPIYLSLHLYLSFFLSFSLVMNTAELVPMTRDEGRERARQRLYHYMYISKRKREEERKRERTNEARRSIRLSPFSHALFAVAALFFGKKKYGQRSTCNWTFTWMRARAPRSRELGVILDLNN